MADKSPGAFRTISEVADALDVPAHVLRFWETRFTQIKPIKRGGGRRYYRPNDVDLIRGIQTLLYRDGMTIKGAQKVLRAEGVRHVMAMGQEAAAKPAPTRRSAPPPEETANVPEMAADATHESFGAGFAETPKTSAPKPSDAAVPVADTTLSPEETLEPEATDVMDSTDTPDPQTTEAIRDLLAKLENLRDRMRAP